MFGAGDIAQAHTKDEWVDLEQVQARRLAYYQIAVGARVEGLIGLIPFSRPQTNEAPAILDCQESPGPGPGVNASRVRVEACSDGSQKTSRMK